MTYRLLALDIDGTLLKTNHKLTKETKEAIEYVRNKGVYVTLATGRTYPSARKVAKALKIEDHELITHDGAFIGSSVEEPMFVRRLDSDRTYQVVDILENYHCHIRLLHEKYALANKIKQKNHLVARMNMGVGDPLFYGVNFVDSLSHHIIDQPITVPKIKAHFWNDIEREDALEELEEAVPGIRLTSSDESSIDITDETVSKARGLQIIGQKLGIGLHEMVAVGSFDNDRDMIAQVGLGVAMGQAPAPLREAADWVTRSNDQNGVGYMVREVFRKQLKVTI
ncbi:Cof-type HAD-IIB family hydrolase [Alteribacter keqinensis]|uniref:HAD family phosphatase n=1 Tax=Alteribacter keqinensis TaxID=2483800 RepID=A0A3M7TSS7_9BACI|nr:HAD family hydrolase [Alteribacter keqinensis]RNA68690.1 HAD family phosphatase [Alteribacter keqinensis]